MPGLTRHPLLCRVALGNSLLQWIPAFAGMGVGVDAQEWWRAATPVTMPGLTRHPLLCRVALGNSLLQWIPAFAGMGVGMDSCFRRNGSGSVRRSGGRCAAIIMSGGRRHHVTMPGLTRHPLSCRVALGNSLPGMGVGVEEWEWECAQESCFAGHPASMSRCPGQLTAPMDSCFRRNGSGNGFLLSQEWEWECAQEWWPLPPPPCRA